MRELQIWVKFPLENETQTDSTESSTTTVSNYQVGKHSCLANKSDFPKDSSLTSFKVAPVCTTHSRLPHRPPFASFFTVMFLRLSVVSLILFMEHLCDDAVGSWATRSCALAFTLHTRRCSGEQLALASAAVHFVPFRFYHPQNGRAFAFLCEKQKRYWKGWHNQIWSPPSPPFFT